MRSGPLFTVVFSLLLANTDALKCRICQKARFREDCNHIMTCSAGEECFMEETITDDATIQYTGGCRSTKVCRTAAQVSIGKRSLVACSRCCNSHDLCADTLCGLAPSDKNSTAVRCYSCGDDDAGSKAVENLNECSDIATCQIDEICSTREIVSGGKKKFEMGCKPLNLCLVATHRMLTDLQNFCTATGKCKRADIQTCGVCCGDSLCNNNECSTVLLKLYRLKDGHNLDMNSLRTIRT